MLYKQLLDLADRVSVVPWLPFPNLCQPVKLGHDCWEGGTGTLDITVFFRSLLPSLNIPSNKYEGGCACVYCVWLCVFLNF